MATVLRDKSIKIRVTADELAELNARKIGSELARWMRDHCLTNANPKRHVPNADPALLRSLAAIGNNLNQVAKQLNMQQIKPSESISVLVELQRIADALDNIRGDRNAN